MTKEELKNEVFDLMEINEVEVLFTSIRIDRTLVPSHLYVYDIRANDDNTNDFATIEEKVKVNHTGTIISKSNMLNSAEFVDITDYNFVGEESSLDDFIHGDMDIENVVSKVNGNTYRMFRITIKGKNYCVAEEKLEEHITDCIEKNLYHLVQGIDESFGYYVPQDVADTEDVLVITRSMEDVIDDEE